jgi:hypothetical protein
MTSPRAVVGCLERLLKYSLPRQWFLVWWPLERKQQLLDPHLHPMTAAAISVAYESFLGMSAAGWKFLVHLWLEQSLPERL